MLKMVTLINLVSKFAISSMSIGFIIIIIPYYYNKIIKNFKIKNNLYERPPKYFDC